MAYVHGQASRSHVGHAPRSTDSFFIGPAFVTVRVLPVAGLGIFFWEVLMLIAKAPKKLIGMLQGMVARQRLRAELTALDDRLLADIGIERNLIDGVVAGQVRRDAKAPVPAQATVAKAANENAAGHRTAA